MDKNKAQEIVNGLGLRLYLRDGRLHQHPPGEEIVPQTKTETASHGITNPPLVEVHHVKSSEVRRRKAIFGYLTAMAVSAICEQSAATFTLAGTRLSK
jgi:hypothetical protein